MPREIRVPLRRLRQSGIILLGAVLCFTLLGAFVSPLDAQGVPLLLLPEVKAFENYRRSARAWISDLALLDGEIRGIVQGGSGDLFSRSRSAQRVLEEALGIAQAVDRAQVPPACVEIHQEMARLSLAYLEAARAALGAVSVPDEVTLETASNALAAARAARLELEENPWLQDL